MNYLDIEKELPGIATVSSEAELSALVSESIKDSTGHYYTAEEIKSIFMRSRKPTFA